MPAALAPEVLSDPIGVIVNLVAERDPDVDLGAVAEVVAAVAGGRAKQRRLAQALLDAPGVLADGRSPAPRAIGDLLTALRKAGVHAVAAPVCAECGKQLLPSNAVVRTGTARSAAPSGNPAPAAGRPVQ
jgi:hypothetical protein